MEGEMGDDSYQLKVSKLLIEAEPDLMACCPKATGRVCFALAEVMGAFLANVLEKKGEENYLGAMRLLFMKTDETARKVQSIAHGISENGDPKRQH